MPNPSVIPAIVDDHRDVVEQAIRDQMERSSNSLPLYRMMQYQLGWVDQQGAEEITHTTPRFYGGVCMEASRADEATRQVGPEAGAAAVELLTASLAVHEEMESAAQSADARPSVWWVWGPAQAINVGDGLHALARLAIFQLRGTDAPAELTLSAMSILDAAALRYYEGQYLELTYQERVDITEEQYLKMAEAKRGALLGAAVALGARTTGADEARVEAFRAFGECLGVASQIYDDVALIWTEGGAARDSGRVLNKSKLFPVAYALEHAAISQKRALGNIYFKRVMEPSDIPALRDVLDVLDTREKSLQRAASLADQAVALLKPARLSDAAMARWESVAAALVGR
ncbi:MAG: polyprenyl synthetase family protein [Dehalococcoidia bacterium]